jgi:hypothetical protein
MLYKRLGFENDFKTFVKALREDCIIVSEDKRLGTLTRDSKFWEIEHFLLSFSECHIINDEFHRLRESRF